MLSFTCEWLVGWASSPSTRVFPPAGIIEIHSPNSLRLSVTDNYVFGDFSHFICNVRNIIHAATRDSAVSSLPEDSTDGFRELDRSLREVWVRSPSSSWHCPDLDSNSRLPLCDKLVISYLCACHYTLSHYWNLFAPILCLDIILWVFVNPSTNTPMSLIN